MKKSLPAFIVIGAVSAIFVTLLQKRLEAAKPAETWEPVSFG